MRFSAHLSSKRSGVEIRLPDIANFRAWAATESLAVRLGHKAIYDTAATLARLGKPMWTPLGYDQREWQHDEGIAYWTSIDVTMEHLFPFARLRPVSLPAA